MERLYGIKYNPESEITITSGGTQAIYAAIAAVAREHKRTVLTDDLDLYLMLQRDKVEGVNFTHLSGQ